MLMADIRKAPFCDDASPAHLFELWQDEGKEAMTEELELDLLSEEGIIQEEWLLDSTVTACGDVHCVAYGSPDDATSLLPRIDLVAYDIAELEQPLQDEECYSPSKKRSNCTFYNYPPMTHVVKMVHGKAVFSDSPPCNKRRKVSEDREYIPSVADLKLPSKTQEHAKDPVSKYLHDRLQELVEQFQSSYTSVMESKRKLNGEQQA